MYKSTVVKHFGNKSKVAAALGISHVAVNRWGKIIPFRRAYEISRLENCSLKLDPSLYGIDSQPKSAA